MYLANVMHNVSPFRRIRCGKTINNGNAGAFRDFGFPPREKICSNFGPWAFLIIPTKFMHPRYVGHKSLHNVNAVVVPTTFAIWR